MRGGVSRVTIPIIVVLVLIGTVPISVGAHKPVDSVDGSVDSYEMTVSVTDDGTVERVELELKLDADAYREQEQMVAEMGYESVAEWYATVMTATNAYERVETTETRAIDGAYQLELSFSEIDVAAELDLDVSVANETMRFSDSALVPESAGSADGTYIVSMPGEVIDSNADVANGTVAAWQLQGEPAGAVTVVSSLEPGATPESEFDPVEDLNTEDESDSVGADDGVLESDDTAESEESNTDPGNDDDDSLPGFGGPVTILGVIVTVVAVRYRRE